MTTRYSTHALRGQGVTRRAIRNRNRMIVFGKALAFFAILAGLSWAFALFFG